MTCLAVAPMSDIGLLRFYDFIFGFGLVFGFPGFGFYVKYV